MSLETDVDRACDQMVEQLMWKLDDIRVKYNVSDVVMRKVIRERWGIDFADIWDEWLAADGDG